MPPVRRRRSRPHGASEPWASSTWPARPVSATPARGGPGSGASPRPPPPGRAGRPGRRGRSRRRSTPRRPRARIPARRRAPRPCPSRDQLSAGRARAGRGSRARAPTVPPTAATRAIRWLRDRDGWSARRARSGRAHRRAPWRARRAWPVHLTALPSGGRTTAGRRATWPPRRPPMPRLLRPGHPRSSRGTRRRCRAGGGDPGRATRFGRRGRSEWCRRRGTRHPSTDAAASTCPIR